MCDFIEKETATEEGCHPAVVGCLLPSLSEPVVLGRGSVKSGGEEPKGLFFTAHTNRTRCKLFTLGQVVL